MTQAVLGIAPVAAAVAASAAPVVPAPVEQGEPTMEELAALIPNDAQKAELVAEAPTEPATEGTDPAAEAKAEPTKVETSDVDAAAARAAKAAAAARAGSRRFAEMKAQQAEAAAAVQRAAREAETLRARVQQAEALERELKEDPYKALKGRGMTDQQLAERALKENTPEAVTEKLAAELRAEREARVALEARLAQQAETARRQAAVAKAEAEFTSTADNEASFPELSKLTAEGQLSIARLALDRITANGHNTAHLTTAQIAEAAEKFIAMTRKPGKVAAPAATKPPVVTAKPSGATLTNKQAQTRTVAPANWDDLSDEQQMAHIAAALPEPT